MSTLQSTTTIASIVGGEARTDAPGGRLTSTNPARTSEVVAEVLLGDAATFADACAAARAAQRDWAKVPAPARGRVIAQVGRIFESNGEAPFAGLTQALERRLVDKVGFTGSSAVGAEIGALCGRHLQSPCLELGGKNPMVVMDDADLDLAVEGALFAGFGTAGQRCTSLGTAIVHAAVHDEFLRRLDGAVRAAPVGDPAQDVLYGPMLHERFAER